MDLIPPSPDPADAAAVWAVPTGCRVRPSARYLLMTVLLLVPMTLTATLGSISFSSPDGTAIVSFWPAAAFQIVFSIWFGVYGALAGVLGPMLGNALVGGSPFLFIPANAIQCCLAGLWFRHRKLDPRLRAPRDWFGLVVVGCLLANALGAVAGVGESHLRALAAGGPTPDVDFWRSKLLTWFGGNVVPSLFLAPALLKAASPMIVRDAFFCLSFWGGASPASECRLFRFRDLPMSLKLTVMVLVAGVIPLLMVAAWSVWGTVKAADQLAAAMNRRGAQAVRDETERHELLLWAWATRLNHPGVTDQERADLLREWRSIPEAFDHLQIADVAQLEAKMPPEMLSAFRREPVAFYSAGGSEGTAGSGLAGAIRLASMPGKALMGMVVWREEMPIEAEWPNVEAVLVLDRDGNELFRNAPPGLAGWHPGTPRPDPTGYRVRHEGRDWHAAEAMLTRRGWRFITLTSWRAGMAFGLTLIPNSVAVLVNLAIFGSLIAGAAMAGRISGRVLAMAEQVRDSAAEPGALHLPVRGRDEIGYLAQTLNHMSDDLAESVAQLQRVTAEKERLAAEMELARLMQRSVWPDEPPQVAGYEFAAASHPAREVGGDFFDYFVRDDGSVVIMVGDAAGKGLKAAMFITEIHALAHAAALHLATPGPVLGAVNSAMVRGRKPSDNFATMVGAFLEPEQHRLLYASAGHQPPILVRAGEPCDLELGGLPLALMPGTDYGVRSVELAPGDAVIIYTDGVTDAVNTDGDMFGADQLAATVRRAVDQRAGDMLDTILKSVWEFSVEAPQADDITVLVLRRSV